MKKVLLVQPNYRLQSVYKSVKGITPPLGLCYIAAVLEQNKISVKILDANALNLTAEDIAKEASNYDIVGVGFMTATHNFSVRVAQLLDKSILKVAGGPQPTGVPEEVLRDGFDIVVRGEGEKTMLEIAQDNPHENILGISYKQDNKIIHNAPRPVMTDNEIDALPMPARHLLPSNGVDMPYKSAGTRRLPWAQIFTTRGCPYNCYFCHKIFGQNIRFRKPENVVNEIVYLKEKYGIKEIDFYDDSFNFDMDYANKVMDLIIEKNLKIHIRLSSGIRINHINPELLQKFKKAGVDWIGYGIESGNQEVLNKIPKAITLEQVRNAVRWTKEAGITMNGFMMLGLLGDTKETMQQTIDFAKELDLDMVAFNMLTPYPGSRLWDEVKKNGKLLLNNWDDFHHSSGKMTFKHPDVAPPEVVEDMYRKAYREFYIRPKYILKRVLNIHNFDDFKLMLKSPRALLYMIKRKPSKID